MKITLLAVGRIKRGPERELVDDYLKRAKVMGRQLGIRDVSEIEVEAGGRQADEGDALLAKIPVGAHVILMEERGTDWKSQAFANHLERLKDQGQGDLVFMIGGADGFTDEIKAKFSDQIRFGSLTWPHKLVRVLAAEQIYRALTIIHNHPYAR